MSLRVVAKRVVLDPYRTRYLWVELGLFGLFFGLIAYFRGQSDSSLGSVLVLSVYLFVILMAVAPSYGTIASRRQNGSLRVMLSYPHSRRAIVLGTALGRSLIHIGTVSFGVVVAVVVFVYHAGVLPAPMALLHSWLAVLLLGVTMTWLTVGISAGTQTTNRAALVAFTAIILFVALWQFIPDVIHYALTGSWPSPRIPTPGWVDLVTWLNPIQAYFAVAGELTNQTWGTRKFYAPEWFGVIVLLVWGLLSLVLGYWQLERSDL